MEAAGTHHQEPQQQLQPLFADKVVCTAQAMTREHAPLIVSTPPLLQEL